MNTITACAPVFVAQHGERRTYQGGCRCTPCRAANAQYQAVLRKYYAMGKAPLGRLVPATEAKRRLRCLTIEGFSQAEVARRLGLSHPRVLWGARQVRLRRLLELRRLYRQVILTAGS